MGRGIGKLDNWLVIVHKFNIIIEIENIPFDKIFRLNKIISTRLFLKLKIISNQIKSLK
jgi:hypothetical protein